MRLEDVTMEIRPRTDWEAIDSGLAMVRRDFWRCWLLWWLVLTPVWMLIYPMRESPWWWLTVMLWAKWIGCRMVLFQLSRRLFGENPTWRTLWREMPRAWGRRFFYRMIAARISPWKPLSAAVEELEGLRGEKFRLRMRMITRKGEGNAILLTMMSACSAVWLAFALLMTGLLFFPETLQQEWLETFDPDRFFDHTGYAWLGISCLTVACSLVDGFITGAGFGMYVNSRTWIEGWDIELAFKRIANRLKDQLLWVVAAFVLWGAPMAEGNDGGEQPTAREAIGQIKASEDFIVHKESYRAPKPSSPSGSLAPPAGILSVMGALGNVLLGVFLLLIVAGIAWLIYRSHLLRPQLPSRIDRTEKARVVMGMEVTAASLPDDVLASAEALWQKGDRLQALSLLYRGSLAWWIDSVQVGILESDTEGDCLRRIAALRHPHGSYFHTLTQAWLMGAYAQHFPPQESWLELCRQWPFRERRLA